MSLNAPKDTDRQLQAAVSRQCQNTGNRVNASMHIMTNMFLLGHDEHNSITSGVLLHLKTTIEGCNSLAFYLTASVRPYATQHYAMQSNREEM